MYSGNWQIKTIKKANAILRMRSQGMSGRDVGDLLNMHPTSVSLLARKIMKYPNLLDQDVKEVVLKGGESK